MRASVGYLGPVGTFSEEAAETLLAKSGLEADLVPCSSISAVVQAVEEGRVTQAVLPLENSLEGTVTQTLDGLTRSRLVMTGELVLAVKHCLMAQPGTSLPDITKVLSHPQALAQCRRFLSSLADVDQIAVSSTAEAGLMVASSSDSLAAIARKTVADNLGLEVLAEDIQDVTDNYTRFVSVSCQPAIPTGVDKTSIAFSLPGNQAGSLYDALGIFAHHGLTLTKIESRPARRLLGEYLFFVDFRGHGSDQMVRKALDELQAQCDFFRLLGSYEMAPYYVR